MVDFCLLAAALVLLGKVDVVVGDQRPVDRPQSTRVVGSFRSEGCGMSSDSEKACRHRFELFGLNDWCKLRVQWPTWLSRPCALCRNKAGTLLGTSGGLNSAVEAVL